MHEATRVDTGDRRVSVDQRGKDPETVAFAGDLEPDLRSGTPSGGRQLLGLDENGDALLQVRDYLGDQLRDALVSEESTPRQVGELASRQLIGCEGMQRVAELDDPVAKGTNDPLVLLDEEAHPIRGVDDPRDQPNRFGLDTDRLAVESDEGALCEAVHHRREIRPGGRVGGPRGELAIDGDVGRRGDERRADLLSARRSGEAASQDGALALVFDQPGQPELALAIFEGVDDAALFLPLRRKPVATLARAANGDDGRGDVVAGIVGLVTAALPILVVGMQRDLRRLETLSRHDPERDAFGGTLLDAHRISARKGDTSGPDGPRAGLLYGLEKRLHRIQKRRSFRVAGEDARFRRPGGGFRPARENPEG